MAAKFLENYLVVRKLYPRHTKRTGSRLSVDLPKTSIELEYRDLLSEANENYFHREHLIALSNYQELRQLILIQSHPEMPKDPYNHVLIGGVGVATWERLVELTRKLYERADSVKGLKIPVDPGPLINPGEFAVNPLLEKFSSAGYARDTVSVKQFDSMRAAARDHVREGSLKNAKSLYAAAHKASLKAGRLREAGEILNESAVMMATYAGGQTREQEMAAAARSLRSASTLFRRLGDTGALNSVQANLVMIERERGRQRSANKALAEIPEEFQLRLVDGSSVNLRHAVDDDIDVVPAARSSTVILPEPVTQQRYLLADGGSWSSVVYRVAAAAQPTVRTVGLLFNPKVKTLSLAKNAYGSSFRSQIYAGRKTATNLEALSFFEEIVTNFVAYIPHLYFFVLPVAIGDTYAELGRYADAIAEYQEAAKYAFINSSIESAFLWLRMARTYAKWGDEQFRQERTALAKEKYENIIRTDLTVPVSAPPYKGPAMSAMRDPVREAVKRIKGLPHAAVNPQVVALVLQTHIQLQKLDQGLTVLGLAPDHAPIFRFRYLQNVANYMADHAVQMERTFINYRVAAENQKFERMHLQNDLQAKEAGLAIERMRMSDAALEVQYAGQALAYTQQRAIHAQATLNDWDTLGAELVSVNAALAWASNAANDQDINYTGVRYNGTSHNFSTDVEDFYDVVGEWREWLNFDIQRNRLARQAAELATEINLAQTRVDQAQVRLQIQAMSVQLAELRVEAARELLEYAGDRMFDEDLWFRLAAEYQDLSREYLDMAIRAAFIMERAYDVEFDRNLNRIRFDYGIGGVQGLLGGEYLKRDIASFNIDFLENAQKKNPVRLAISLRDEYPAEFQLFVREGILPFRTDLEIFDRRYPGTYHRKIKQIEVFVEGLVPSEGVHGHLLHQGVSTDWRQVGGNWHKHSRVMPPERMVLSTYQFRRDVVVFQPSQEMLGQFENLSPEGNWTLELPRSVNDIDYEAITDIKFVVYFDAEHDDDLAVHIKGHYPSQGGKSLLLSSRFHFPDEYFRLDADRGVTFTVHESRIQYNYENPAMNAFRVRVTAQDGSALTGIGLTVTRLSDGSVVSGTTDASGAVIGHPVTMAPFEAWKDASPVDAFRVALDAGTDTTTIGDILLSIGYAFDHRADGTVTA